MPFTVFNIQDGGREGGREGRERAGKEKRKRERRNTMLKDDKLSSGSSPGPGFLASSHCSPISRHRDSLAHPDGTKWAPLLLFPLPWAPVPWVLTPVHAHAPGWPRSGFLGDTFPATPCKVKSLHIWEFPVGTSTKWLAPCGHLIWFPVYPQPLWPCPLWELSTCEWTNKWMHEWMCFHTMKSAFHTNIKNPIYEWHGKSHCRVLNNKQEIKLHTYLS